MKVRKGWRITWPDGTTWDGDCPKWASAPVMADSTVTVIRILGKQRQPCSACLHNVRH